MNEQELAMRLARLEARVNAIMQHLGLGDPAPTTTASTRVLELVSQGRTIEAIKAYREESGADLRSAKEYIESLPAF